MMYLTQSGELKELERYSKLRKTVYVCVYMYLFKMMNVYILTYISWL